MPQGTSGKPRDLRTSLMVRATPVQELDVAAQPAAFVFFQSLNRAQVECCHQALVADAGQQHPVQVFFQELHFWDHGVPPEHPLRRVHVGKGGPFEVGQQGFGHAEGPADLLQTPSQALDEVHVPVAEAEGLDITDKVGDCRTVGVGRAFETGVPTVVEVPDFLIGHGLVGQHHEIGPGGIPQEITVEPEPVLAHVDGHAGRGQRRQSGEFFQGVEVAHPDYFVGSVGHRPVTALVDKASNVGCGVGDDSHPVGPQGPDFPVAVFVPLHGPEYGAPQVQIDLGGPPQVSLGVPPVDPVQQPLSRVGGPHGNLDALGSQPGNHQSGSPQGLGTQLDGGIDRNRSGVVFAVFAAGPTAAGARCTR